MSRDRLFLYQPISGYCYNSDSIFLYQFISKLEPKGSVLDVGCGVGIISLLLSRDFDIQTTIIDKQEFMLEYAKHNFAINGLEVLAVQGDFIEWVSEDRFDYIVSNPPFYDPRVTQSQDTSLNIARYAHHLPLESFIKRVKRYLKPKGWFVFCYDAKQLDLIMYYLKEYGITPEIVRFVHSKIDRDSKLVFIAARNNSKSMTKIASPLVVFGDDDKYALEANQAFEMANTHSIKAQRDKR
jgi:tRNA1(Val) A37 N6-methylase TrmN6